MFFLALGFLHGEFTDDVSETIVGSTTVFETSSVNSPLTPCKNPQAKTQYSTHTENIKSKPNNKRNFELTSFLYI